MSFTVEDGTGLSDANSYASVADGDAYFLDRGAPVSWSGATTAERETALIFSTQFIDAEYVNRWKGARTNETQALAWPRAGVTDDDDFTIDDDALPTKLLEATYEGALKSVGGEDLIPDLTDDGTLERKRVKVGSLEVDKKYSSPKSATPDRQLMDSLLSAYLRGQGSLIVRA